MKKTILTILLCGITILFLTGCGSKIGKTSDIEITNDDISITIKDDTLTNTGATFVLENNSNQTLGYGEPYHLEIKDDDSWYILNTINDAVFIMPFYHLDPNESIELKIDWENFYGILEPGEYRLIKDACFVVDDETSDNFYIGVEFIIE